MKAIPLPKTLLLVALLAVLVACAPKKVRLYEVSDTVRGGVVQTALALHGKPYRGGAKGPDSFDCSGLVHFVFRQFRVALPVTAEAQGRTGLEVGRESVRPADLVLFKIDKDPHVGIMINSNEFVHASKSRGVTVDAVDATYWRKRLVGFRSVL